MNKQQLWKKESFFLLISIPTLLVYFVFFLLPILQSFFFSFYQWDGLSPDKTFVGLKNFEVLFTKTPLFYTSLLNNIIYMVVVTVVQSVIAFFMAMLLYKAFKGAAIFKTIYFMPVAISSVAVSFIWAFIYDPNIGALNTILNNLGLSNLAQSWLGNPQLALYSVAIVQIWQYAGFAMILFIAGLHNIPNDLYEVAHLEGASAWQRTRYVTLPLLAPAMTIVLVLTTIGCFKVFDLVYVMTGGGPAQSTQVLALMIYDETFKYNRIGTASAISIVLLAVIAGIGFLQYVILRSKETQG